MSSSEPAASHAPASDVTEIAAHLRHGALTVELDEAPDGPGRTTLLAWGYFNPFGSTACRIDALPVPGTGELLLISASEHQACAGYHAIALIPPDGDQATAIRTALAEVFDRNGGGSEWSLFGGVPSYVHLLPNSVIDVVGAAELFRSGIRVAGGMFGNPPDYRQEIEDLLSTWKDPWKQAAVAFNRGLNSAGSQRLLAQVRALEAHESSSVLGQLFG